MILERRIIEDVIPGSTSHALLQAGRSALPPPGSRQRLLDALLQRAAVSGGDAVLHGAPIGKWPAIPATSARGAAHGASLRPAVARQTAFTPGERNGQATRGTRKQPVARGRPVVESIQRSLDDNRLGMEVRQLDAARDAGKPGLAESVLSDYSKHFPNAWLAPEARLLQAQIVELSSD